MRILAVDDDPCWTEILQLGLTRQGFTVDIASNGRAAIERGAQHHYDAFLIDVLMPEMDGYAVVQELRKIGVSAPIVMVSCQSQRRDLATAMSAGADDYMVKPVVFSELTLRIHSVLCQKQVSAAAAREPQCDPTRP